MMNGHIWVRSILGDRWLIILVVLRCQSSRCSRSQLQGQTTASPLKSQTFTPPFSKAQIRPRASPPLPHPPHRFTLQPTTSLLVDPVMLTGRKSYVYTCLCVGLHVHQILNPKAKLRLLNLLTKHPHLVALVWGLLSLLFIVTWKQILQIYWSSLRQSMPVTSYSNSIVLSLIKNMASCRNRCL